MNPLSTRDVRKKARQGRHTLAASSAGQPKIVQEGTALTIFVRFAAFAMKKPLRFALGWPALLPIGAAYLIFRDA